MTTYLEIQQELKFLKKHRKKLAETIEYLTKCKQLSLVICIGSEFSGNGFQLQCPELVLNDSMGSQTDRDFHEHLFKSLDEYYRQSYEEVSADILVLKGKGNDMLVRLETKEKDLSNVVFDYGKGLSREVEIEYIKDKLTSSNISN